MSTPEAPRARGTDVNGPGLTTAQDAALAHIEARLQALEQRLHDTIRTG